MAEITEFVDRKAKAVAKSGRLRITDQQTAEEDMLLMERVARGDPRSFDRIFARYSGMAYALALNRTHSVEISEDVAADVMLRVYRSARTFHAGSRLSTWITKIAINSTIDAIRRKARDKSVSFDEALDGYEHLDEWDFGSVDPADPEDCSIDHEQLDVLRVVLTGLEDSRRELLLMYYRDHQPCAQIAEALHVPVGTVKSKLHRARNSLRKDYDSAWEQHCRSVMVPIGSGAHGSNCDHENHCRHR